MRSSRESQQSQLAGPHSLPKTELVPEPVPELEPEPEPSSQQTQLSSSSVGYEEPGAHASAAAAPLRVDQSDQRPPYDGYDGPLKKDGTPDKRTKAYRDWLAKCQNYASSGAQ